MAEGRLSYRAHVFEGLEPAPEALNAMFTGENIGKILVRVDPDAEVELTARRRCPYCQRFWSRVKLGRSSSDTVCSKVRT